MTLGDVGQRLRCTDCGAMSRNGDNYSVLIYEPLDQSPFHERVRWQPRLWRE